MKNYKRLEGDWKSTRKPLWFSGFVTIVPVMLDVASKLVLEPKSVCITCAKIATFAVLSTSV